MADKRKGKGYAGKITNSSVMVVEAPFTQGKTEHGTVKRGTDIRKKQASPEERKNTERK